MRFSALLMAVLASVASPVQAFSNGTLLPSYLCGVNDGLPKTVGAVIRFFETDHIFDRGYPVASWHQQKPPNPEDIQNRQLNDVCLIPKPNTVLVNPTANFNMINLDTGATGDRNVFPGQEIALDLITRNAAGIVNKDILQAPGKAAGLVAQMLGAFVYAVDAKGNRVGRFTGFGTDNLMQPWAACGPNAVGIVHNFVLNETEVPANPANPQAGGMPIYTGIKWKAPANLVVGSTITFQGVGVTRFGFGPHSTVYNVVAAPIGVPSAPTITQVFVLPGSQAFLFFEGAAANPAISMFTVNVNQAGQVTTFTGKFSPIWIKWSPRRAGMIVVSMIATNAQGASMISNTKTITPGNGFQIVSASTEQSAAQTAQLLQEFNALCTDKRPDYVDADNKCAWAAQPSSIDLVFNAAARDAMNTTDTNINSASTMQLSMLGMIMVAIINLFA